MISVVIPSYRRPIALTKCLRALADQTLTAHEIVVVLRRDDDLSQEVVRLAGLRRAKTVVVDRPGVLAAMQAGVLSCTADVVAFTDDDAVPARDWLARLHDGMKVGVGAVGGRDHIALEDRPLTCDVGRITRWGKLIGNHHLGAGGMRSVDVLKGVNMAIRREALAIPEGLAGDGAQVHFEVAVSLYVRRAGWRVIYDPSIIVRHFPAERHDNDRRYRPDREAVRARSYNLVLCLLTFRRDLVAKRAIYGILVGDQGSPGVIRGMSALARRERGVLSAVLPSLRGQIEAIGEILRGGGVSMVAAPSRPDEP